MAELESTGTYKIFCNVYDIFKINVLTIICLYDFTAAPRRRGPNVNHQAIVNLFRAPTSSCIMLQLDEHILKFVGQSAVCFATECDIVLRQDCPMKYYFWRDMPAEFKTRMIHRLPVTIINYN